MIQEFYDSTILMLQTFSKIGYVVMVSGLVGLLATHSLFSASPLVIVPQAGAVLLMLWARITFGRRSFHFAASPTEGGLVTVGPYRYIRHPIYTAVCLFVLVGAAAHPSWHAALLCGLIICGALVRIRCEEILLMARYPDYKSYGAKTWRMVPFVF
jgi:protein-S-isoprenylcysteine O-methyltransferase Ste14